MKSSKDYIEEFEVLNYHFALRGIKIRIPYQSRIFTFDEKGFSMELEYNKEKIIYTLNELSSEDLGLLWYLLPHFQSKIDELIKRFI